MLKEFGSKLFTLVTLEELAFIGILDVDPGSAIL